MKYKTIFYAIFCICTFSGCTKNEDLDNKSVFRLTHGTSERLPQNYYLVKNGIPVNPLERQLLVSTRSLGEMESLFEKQLMEFNKDPRSDEQEFSKRSVFTKEMSEMFLKDYGLLDNAGEKSKAISYAITYLKTGMYDVEFSTKLVNFLNRNKELSVLSNGHVAFLIQKTIDHKIDIENSSILELKEAIKVDKDKGKVAFYKVMVKATTDNLNMLKEEQVKYSSIPVKSFNVSNDQFLRNEFLKPEVSTMKVSWHETLSSL